MADIEKRRTKVAEAFEPFASFDRLLDDWMQAMPFWRPSAGAQRSREQMIRVDQLREDGTLVIRAEIPGIDPDKDVEVSVSDRLLTIRAERREEERTDEAGYLRRELRTGSFSRTLTLPEGVTEADITASYRHGILEVRVPMPESGEPQARTIPVSSD